MTKREAARLMEELEGARKELRKSEECLSQREEELKRHDEEIVRLKMKVQALILQIFGKSSEKLDAAQLQMLLDGIEPGKDESSGDADAPAQDDDAEKRTQPSHRLGAGGRRP